MAQHTQAEGYRSNAPLLRRLTNRSSGAAIALMSLLHHERTLGEPIGEEVQRCLTMLDILGICGDDLCVLWFDICRHDVGEMSSLLRACHEGCDGVSRDAIWQAITYRK